MCQCAPQGVRGVTLADLIECVWLDEGFNPYFYADPLLPQTQLSERAIRDPIHLVHSWATPCDWVYFFLYVVAALLVATVFLIFCIYICLALPPPQSASSSQINPQSPCS